MYLGGNKEETERKEEKERKLQSKEEPASIYGTEETWVNKSVPAQLYDFMLVI